MIEPIGPYATAYLTAMAFAAWAVRDRPALTAAMRVVGAEWLFLRLWHDLVDSRSTVMMHAIADFVAVYALIRWVPLTNQSAAAEQCFRAMLLLHFAWAFNLVTTGKSVDQFTYLSLYNGLGYLAMVCIAGGAAKDDISAFIRRRRRPVLPRLALRQSYDPQKNGKEETGE